MTSVDEQDRVALEALRKVRDLLGRIEYPFYDAGIENDITLVTSRVKAVLDVLEDKA